MTYLYKNMLLKIAKSNKSKDTDDSYIYDTIGGGKQAFIDSASSIPGKILESAGNRGPDGKPGGAPLTHGAEMLGILNAHMGEKIDTPEELRDDSLWGLVPGVGTYRNERRHIYVDNTLSKGKNTHRSRLAEILGGRVSAIIPMILGSVAGSILLPQLMGTSNRSPLLSGQRVAGGAIGAGITGLGILGAQGIGRLIGLLKHRRTDREHAEYLENGPVLAQYLIPGVSGYQRGRRARMAENIIG